MKSIPTPQKYLYTIVIVFYLYRQLKYIYGRRDDQYTVYMPYVRRWWRRIDQPMIIIVITLVWRATLLQALLPFDLAKSDFLFQHFPWKVLILIACTFIATGVAYHYIIRYDNKTIVYEEARREESPLAYLFKGSTLSLQLASTCTGECITICY